ncbi:hypothetical protein V502_02485 [Pseudogymnoascus sp. VKM F-4520 (FW-2644)]|nr:hypothetical protein V502_02485 [Pseudogymnoascus sp. VKM F-4520 (FW-2644)]
MVQIHIVCTVISAYEAIGEAAGGTVSDADSNTNISPRDNPTDIYLPTGKQWIQRVIQRHIELATGHNQWNLMPRSSKAGDLGTLPRIANSKNASASTATNQVTWPETASSPRRIKDLSSEELDAIESVLRPELFQRFWDTCGETADAGLIAINAVTAEKIEEAPVMVVGGEGKPMTASQTLASRDGKIVGFSRGEMRRLIMEGCESFVHWSRRVMSYDILTIAMGKL